jgi:hypothetical protein
MTLRSQLDDAQRKIRDLEDEVSKLKKVPKSRLDVPPHWIIRGAKQAFGRTGHWSDAYSVLSAYYGVPKVRNLCDDEKVPKGADGAYYHWENTVYGKKGGMSLWVAMHEFAHHLCANVIPIGGEAEQAFCDSFATEVKQDWDEP